MKQPKKSELSMFLEGVPSNQKLKNDLEVLDRAYPEIGVEFIEIKGVFGSDLISELSEKWNIPKTLYLLVYPKINTLIVFPI